MQCMLVMSAYAQKLFALSSPTKDAEYNVVRTVLEGILQRSVSKLAAVSNETASVDACACESVPWITITSSLCRNKQATHTRGGSSFGKRKYAECDVYVIRNTHFASIVPIHGKLSVKNQSHIYSCIGKYGTARTARVRNGEKAER